MAELQQECTLYFDGEGDYIEIEDDSSLRPDKYTLEVWVKTDGVPDEYITTIAAKGNSYGIWLNNSGGISHRYTSDYGNNIACDIEGSVIFPDLWHHVAITNDGAKVRTYVDGDLKKEDEVQGTLNPTPDTFLRIGVDPEETNPTKTKSAFKGNLTELRLWNKARSQSEIKSTMFKRLVGYEESLIGYWPLDNIEGNIAIDHSNSGNYGKIYGVTTEGQLPSIAPKDIQIGENIYTRQYALSYPFPAFNTNPASSGDRPTVDIRNVPLFSNAITVACWAKRPAGSTSWGGTYIPLVVRTNGLINNNSNYHWMLYVSNTNNVYFVLKINGTFRTATYTPTKDDPLDLTKWHHYAATFDGYAIRLYVDGVEKALANYSGQIDDGNEPISIGYKYYRHSNGYYYEQVLQGEIAQVQLWNRVLSDGTIKESMFKPLKGDEEGLVGYWLLNEGQGELAFDEIPNYSSHHGKLAPKATWSDQLPIGTDPSNWGNGGPGTGGPGTGGPEGGTDSGIGGSTEAGKTYQIASPSGLVLTVFGNVGSDGADVRGGSNQGIDGQKWTITEEGNIKVGSGEFALDMVPVGDDTKQSVQIKAIDPSSPTQKWELTDNGRLKNKSNGFVVVLMEYASYPGNYFVDAFSPTILPQFPYWPVTSYEYTWQFNEV